MTKIDQLEICQTISPCIYDNRSEKSIQVEKIVHGAGGTLFR